MNNRAILGISLAAIFAVSMLGSAYANGHLGIESYTIVNKGKSQSVHIELGAAIPDLPAGNFGWAVPTSNDGFLVIASHPVADDSTAQPPNVESPSEKMHTHFLTAGSTNDCASGITPTFATKNEVGRLSINDDRETIWVKNVPRGLAGDLLATGAFGFTLTIEDVNGDSTDSLCINPV